MTKNAPNKKQEQELLKLFHADKLRSVDHVKKEIKRYRESAKFTNQKTRSINIRLPDKDVAKIKAMAMKSGVPYQTLIASVLHRISLNGK